VIKKTTHRVSNTTHEVSGNERTYIKVKSSIATGLSQKYANKTRYSMTSVDVTNSAKIIPKPNYT